VLVWFSAPTCRVCSELKPKVGEMIRRSYPRIALFEVNCEENRLTAAQQQVFAVPTLLLFLEGKEQLRRSRHFSPAELEREISRPYSLLFG
jgi:thioredoxin 1